jgi:N-acetylmuramoyl-L-alanine amidase CwlA
MEPILDLLTHFALQVWITLTHNWPFLIVSIVIEVGLKLFIDVSKVSNFLNKNRTAGVVGVILEKNNLLKNQSRYSASTSQNSKLQQVSPSISKQNFIPTQIHNNPSILNFSMVDAQHGSTSFQMTPIISKNTSCGCFEEQKQPQSCTNICTIENSEGNPTERLVEI